MSISDNIVLLIIDNIFGDFGIHFVADFNIYDLILKLFWGCGIFYFSFYHSKVHNSILF
jgi:hypothetical protein